MAASIPNLAKETWTHSSPGSREFQIKIQYQMARQVNSIKHLEKS